jgi:flavin-dependent dehydrogenase
LRKHLQVLCEHYGIRLDELTNLRGHRLPMRRPQTKLARGRGLVVGDAAGMIDPVSGDGMYEAFVTGQLAADHIVAGDVEGYETAAHRRLDQLASAGWGAKKALDRFPRAVFAIMRLPFTWPVLEKLILGDVAHPGEAKGAGLTAMKAVKTLARAA